jgi:hypothetical protein
MTGTAMNGTAMTGAVLSGTAVNGAAMTGRAPISRIAAVGAQDRVAVTGVILSATTEIIGTSPALRCVLADGSGEIDLLFLGWSAIAGLEPARRCTARGRACAWGGRLVIWNPRYQLEATERR